LIRLLGPDWQERDKIGLIQPSEDRAARELLGNLGGVSLYKYKEFVPMLMKQLALAIQQAAQLIRNPDIGGMTIASTYAAFKEDKGKLPDRHSGERSEIYKSLDTLWSITFNSLSGNAHDLLSVLSLLSAGTYARF
jgi:hypothetical protein